MRKMGLLFLMSAAAVGAQDRGWVREWESAQRERPAQIGRVARIAPPQEPGVPLVVHGRVVPERAGVVVFAYQTDAGGLYNAEGRRGWRLRGWARTDAEGRFELRTIRPGSYPRSTIPAHIHVTVDGPGLPRRWVEEIHFADDPLLPKNERGLPVRVVNGVQHVDYTIRIEEKGKF